MRKAPGLLGVANSGEVNIRGKRMEDKDGFGGVGSWRGWFCRVLWHCRLWANKGLELSPAMNNCHTLPGRETEGRVFLGCLFFFFVDCATWHEGS